MYIAMPDGSFQAVVDFKRNDDLTATVLCGDGATRTLAPEDADRIAVRLELHTFEPVYPFLPLSPPRQELPPEFGASFAGFDGEAVWAKGH